MLFAMTSEDGDESERNQEFSVFVKNVPGSVTKEQLNTFFESCGAINSIYSGLAL